MKVIIDGKEFEEKQTTKLNLSLFWSFRMKLRAEGDKLWAESIIEAYGNIKIEWKNYSSEKDSYECHLENGDVYKP